jgi:dihydroorotase
MTKIVIQNGRLIDPKSGTDRPCDLSILDGKVAAIAPAGSLGKGADEVINAAGKWVTPGLIDLHVHLREPGEEYKEDIESGARAAVWGGFTTILAMPNTKPVIDSAELVAYVARRGAEVGLCRVLPVGAVTVAQKGETLAPVAEMKRAGAVALSDDGHPVADSAIMRRALEYAADFGLPVLSHAEDPALCKSGQMHEGAVSTRLGLRGIPGIGEDVAVTRDTLLAEHTGGHVHICHVSTARSVAIIAAARARGVHVTAEVTPHHLFLTAEAVVGFDTNAKMRPPLREEADCQALMAGLADGTLDAVATDHAPHSSIEKDVAFEDAANGILGLQTALPLTLELWRRGVLSELGAIRALTYGPAKALGLARGNLAEGSDADLTLIDPDLRWRFEPAMIQSRSKNTPFLGRDFRGKAVLTMVGGRVVYRAI